jgi:hypothetical protein
MKSSGILLALAVLAPAYAADNAQTVLECKRANVPPAIRAQDIELAATDRAGSTRTLKGKLYALSEKTSSGGSLVRAMLKIEGPASYAGASYLVREAEEAAKEGMFVYLPSVRRVKRVSGSFADGSLLGTNFSYNDLKLLSNSFVGSAAKLEASEEIDHRPVYRLLFRTLPGGGSPYNTVRAWVDQKSCVPLKAEFFEGDSVRKRLTASAGALQQSGKYWYLAEVEMSDLKEGTKTVLKLGKVAGATGLPGRYFSPDLFYLGN